MAIGARPKSLDEVVTCGLAHGDTDAFLREFLDEYYVEPAPARRAAMLALEPPIVANDKVNAYVAAVAEHLAHRDHAGAPAWVEGEQRFLHRAYFPCGLESLKATLLMESPAAFRRRMIFVGSDPLYRPRRREDAKA